MRYDGSMSAQWFIPFEKFTTTSAKQIGEKAKFLGEINEKGIAIPLTICITIEALKHVAEEAQLESLVRANVEKTKGLPEAVAKQKFLHDFEKINFPNSFLTDLHSLYNHYFGHGFVRVFSSSDTTQYFQHENVLGEANLIDSVARVWAEYIWHICITKHIKEHISVLCSNPILIQHQPQAITSGKAYTCNPHTKQKNVVLIQARYGEFLQDLDTLAHDTYQVDINTLHIVQRSIMEQTREYRRISEKYTQKNIPKVKAKTQKLSNKDIIDLAKQINILRTLRPQQSVINWIQTPSGIKISHREIFDIKDLSVMNQIPLSNKKTSTQVFISAGNSKKADKQLSQNPDGIGVLKSEFVILALGAAPDSLTEPSKARIFSKEILHTLQTYRSKIGPHKPITYRSNALTTAELNQLRNSTKSCEENPYLGYRGAIRQITRPDFFNLELEILKKHLESSKDPLNLLLPFVRTPIELRLLFELIKQQDLADKTHFSLWWELDTAENILNLSLYPLEFVDTVVLNISAIHAIFHNVDPNDVDLLERYELNTSLITKVFATVKHELSHFKDQHPALQKPQFLVQMEHYDPRIIELGVHTGVSAFIVKPNIVSTAREYIYEVESRLVMTN